MALMLVAVLTAVVVRKAIGNIRTRKIETCRCWRGDAKPSASHVTAITPPRPTGTATDEPADHAFAASPVSSRRAHPSRGQLRGNISEPKAILLGHAFFSW